MFTLFKTATRVNAERFNLEKQVTDLKIERESLDTELRSQKNQVMQLKLDKKIEQEDIAHMLKMLQEAEAVERQKFELNCTKEKNDAIAKLKGEHSDELLKMQKEQLEAGEKRYGEILARLPDINASLKVKAST